jgi:hypothetical protein
MQEPGSNQRPQPPAQRRDSEFLDWLRKGALVGMALLVLPAVWVRFNREAPPPVQPGPVAMAPQPSVRGPAEQQPARPTQPGQSAQREGSVPVPHVPGVRLADFGDDEPTADARLVANWVVHTSNHKQRAFVIVDKKDARVYVFGPHGRLLDSAPALLGSARGDDTFPGVGDKPLAQVRPEEKTTPAGRFVAERGLNATHEDVVWVDYNAAVSMHRVRPLVARERRLERLASLTTDDNRISFGCINLPVTFYEDVLSPMVRQYGAIVYVLPEVKTPQQVFGAYDVTDAGQLAAARRAGVGPMQQVALHPSR